jgi:peptidyl-prolyl cis-trans isomerase C
MEIRERYASDEDFNADLRRIGLDVAIAATGGGARHGGRGGAGERLATRSATVSDTEVEIFWFMHMDRFRRAETRVLRHILVTINETACRQ